MRARKFNKRVEVWQTVVVEDGFGGNLNTEEQLTATWAQVETLGITSRFSGKTESVGLNSTNLGIIVRVRKRNDLSFNSVNQFLKYNGDKYIISSVPTNVNFDNSIIEIIATRELQRTTNTTAPIGGTVFPYTFNFILESNA